MQKLQAASVEIVELQAAGEELSEEQSATLQEWEEMSVFLSLPEVAVQKDLDAYQKGYGEIVVHRAPVVAMMHTSAMSFLVWRVGGLMILGMALMNLGVLSGERRDSFYRKLMLAGYGPGPPDRAVQRIRSQCAPMGCHVHVPIWRDGELCRQHPGITRPHLGLHGDHPHGRDQKSDGKIRGTWPHGADELFDAFCYSDDGVLRLRPRPLRNDSAHVADGIRRSSGRIPALVQPVLAASLSLRAGRMGVEIADLLESAAAATTGDLRLSGGPVERRSLLQNFGL